MIFDSKKFNKEIASLDSLSRQSDPLTSLEMESLKSKVMLGIKAPLPEASQVFSHNQLKEKIIRYFIALIAGLSLVGGTAFASSNAKPGDLLYPVKRAKENVELTLAVSDTSKAKLQSTFATERLKELHNLSEKSQTGSRPTPTPFVTSTPAPTTILGQVGIGSTTNATTTIEQGNSAEGHGNKFDRQIQIQAQQEAGLEVSGAINSLRKIHNKLQAKGDMKGAADIQASILNLQAKAKAENVILSTDDQGGSNNNDNNNGQNNSSNNNDGRDRGQGRGRNRDQFLNLNPTPTPTVTPTSIVPSPTPTPITSVKVQGKFKINLPAGSSDDGENGFNGRGERDN